MSTRFVRLVFLSALLVGVVAGLGVAQEDARFVRGEPDLDAYAPESTLTPGSTSTLTVQVANDGELAAGPDARRGVVTTARSVTVAVADDDVPFTVETDRQAIGSMADGAVREVPITVTVPEDVDPGEYSLDVRLRYSYTSVSAPRSGVTQERSRTERERIDVTIDDSPRFELRTVDSDVQVGGSGTLVTEVRNVGGEPARDLTVAVESTSSDAALGESAGNTARIDRLAPGENATVTYDVGVRPDVSPRSLALTGTVRFTDPDGIRGTDEGLSVGVRPNAEQAFSLSVNESTLRVGETGTVRGVIRNDGPADVNDVVLSLGESQFAPRSPTYAVGDIAAGESATFRFRGAVPPEGDAVPQRIDVTTRYRTRSDEERQTQGSMHVPVAERRDAVAVRAVEPRFDAGEEGVLELEVTNQRDVEIRDVRLTLAAEEPLTSEFRTTVVPSLQPGETGRVAFDLEVDGDAPASRYPATVETTYVDTDGDTNTARPSTVAVTVTETGGEDFPVEFVIFGVLLVVVAAGAWWFYGKR
ncbi:COG1361 S-layer family protein [Natronomonas amylolytica]|uniref:COG1361 S-layer family protein n=1 Tax=Natronomonas amylolytica TaxID=3108498 RepID=UPI003009BA05